MKSHIYWYLKRYPFLWWYRDKIVFCYFMCILSQTLFLTISLLLGSFRYVFNIIIVLTCIVSICRFLVSLSLILLVCTFSYNFYALLLSVAFMYHNPLILFMCIFIYVFIYWKSGTGDILVLMFFVLQCTDYEKKILTLALTLLL